MVLNRKSIFDTPAIVKLANSYLSVSDNAAFARSNRQLFQTVMPLLWESVDGIPQLLKLLPALNPEMLNKNKFKMQVKALTENDLARLNVYAPWIKHIEVGKRTDDSVLDTLCLYAAARTILPNLNSITSTCSDGQPDIRAVLPFLSPSLSRIEFVPGGHLTDAKLSVPESLVLLHLLAEKCPKLKSLSILPKDDPDSEPGPYALKFIPEDNRFKLSDRIKDGLPPYFAALAPLVSLTCSGEILDHACFTTISTWPSLESLVIDLDSGKNKHTLPKLPDTAFPSLTHLGLYWLPNSKTFRQFWNIPALVSKLTSVKILPTGDLCEEKSQFTRVLLPILEMLVEKSPKLEELRFHAVDSNALRAWYDVPISALEVLQKAPMKVLWIEGVGVAEPPLEKDTKNDSNQKDAKKDVVKEIPRHEDKDGDTSENEDRVKDEDGAEEGGDGESEDEEADDEEEEGDDDDESDVRYDRCKNLAERLSAMFPDLVELGFPRHHLPLSDIQTFHSRMPRLETLRFDFELGAVSDLKVDLDSIPRHRHTPPLTIEANYLGLDEDCKIAGISNFKYNDGIHFVQYLFSLRPNAQIVPLPDEEKLSPEDYVVHEKMIALINAYLAALACCNRDPSIKYEDIKVINQDSWARCSK